MGLFSKLKQNFNHGGVKVALQAPYSVSMQDAFCPVTTTITASDAPQTINKVSAEIVAESKNQIFQQPSAAATKSGATFEVVARAENVQPFTLQVGETRTVQLNIVMNADAAMASDQEPNGGAMAQFAAMAQKLQSVSEAMNCGSYTYSIHAKADVEGIALDPGDSHNIQVLRPGEIGAAGPGFDARINL